jgi:hypothetical protein
VRGGEADQNLVLLDGYPIYNPFHMGGLFGAFVEPMVDRVDFITGGFPARYGGRLSSVLDVRSAVEPRSGIHGRADISMIASTVALGSGMQEGRSTWTVALRRTYADKFADIFYQKGSLPYHFRDAQAHATRVLPGEWELSFTAYDNVDDLVQSTIDTSASYTLNWGNRLLGATLSRSFTDRPRLFGMSLGDSARVEQRLSRSRFGVHMDFFESALMLNNRVLDDRASGSLTAYSSRHVRSVGYELARQDFTFGANYPLILYPSDTIANRNVVAGMYYDDLWRPNDRWVINGGLRLDATSDVEGLPVLQPRLSLKYFVNRNFALSAAVGEFAQSTHSLAREDVPIRALDFWVGSGATAPMSRARHFILGAERWLSSSRAVRVEAFLKRYSSLVEQNPHSDPNIAGDEFLRVHGHSYGADMMLRQFNTGRFAGWLAYSFAFSSRVDANGRRFFPGQDRRHEMNVVSNWIGRRYTLSTRFNLASGTPYTRVTGQFARRDYDPVSGLFRYEGLTQFLVGPRNAERLPLAQRLDLSLTRSGRVRGASVSPFLSIMNAYNATNVFAYIFDYTARPPERIGLQQFPVFPTIGVSIAW